MGVSQKGIFHLHTELREHLKEPGKCRLHRRQWLPTQMHSVRAAGSIIQSWTFLCVLQGDRGQAGSGLSARERKLLWSFLILRLGKVPEKNVW